MTKCEKCTELEKENAELASKLQMANAMFVSAQRALAAQRKLTDMLKARIAVMRTKQEGK
jgi:hypothetical protein